MNWELPNGVQRFTIMELINATNGFDKAHEIGEGGFGKVFVGNFPDGRTLAIKRAAPVSSTDGAGHPQFRNEVYLSNTALILLITGDCVCATLINFLILGDGGIQLCCQVLLLSRLHHKNLLRLEGFCDEGEYQVCFSFHNCHS